MDGIIVRITDSRRRREKLLGTPAEVRLNFRLEVAGVATAMSLTGSAPSVAVVDQAGNPVTPPALMPSMLNSDGSHKDNYFKNSPKFVNNPQRAWVTTKDSLNAQCDPIAVADADDNIVLQNPRPGTRGNFGYNRFYNVGTWNADMSLSKAVKIGESKSIQIRVDATNIFNHPTAAGSATNTTPGSRTFYASPPAYSLSGGATYAGDLNSKVGQRTYQARIRFNF